MVVRSEFPRVCVRAVLLRILGIQCCEKEGLLREEKVIFIKI